jgi:hypothetical protein
MRELLHVIPMFGEHALVFLLYTLCRVRVGNLSSMTAKQVIYPKAYSIHKTEGLNFGHLYSIPDEAMAKVNRYRSMGSDAVCLPQIYWRFYETLCHHHIQFQNNLRHM